MPNVNTPMGLVPHKYLDGSSWNGQANLYFIPQADANAYFIGDIVKSVAGASNGLIQPANVFSLGVPAVTKSVAGNVNRGVLVAVMADPNSQQTITVPATKTHDYLVLVADDPAIVYEAQADNVTTLAATVVGKNANFVVAAPSGGIVPTSATVINSATLATTNTLPFKVLGLVQDEGSDFTAFAKFQVAFNTHELKGDTGSTGV